MAELNVLYRDSDILVCEKPAGCLSEPGPGRNLPQLAASYLYEAGQASEIYTVHRLDKEVGGLMVLARTSEAAGALIGMIANRTIQKEYYAVLRGVPQAASGTWEDLLFDESGKNKTYVVDRPRKGVRDAKLSYRLIAREGETSLVRIRLYTGRTHQIRAQFSHRALPLLGDVRYGCKDPGCKTALWSAYLRFPHPKTGRVMTFYQRPPEQYPWAMFDRGCYTAVSPFGNTTDNTEKEV